ncbi:MAG: hypothetical protein BA867_10830 [Desulfobacterales bacterium S5133MH16]|nr:MAG: hypothetical protein BA867_10830 [Desulfobacterales bacterium S5133MH16]
MKGSKKEDTIQSLDNAYLNAIGHKDTPAEESYEESPSAPDDAVLSGKEQAETLTLKTTDISLEELKDWQDKELIVSPDNMSVILRVKGGGPISAYTVNQGLKKLDIVHGIDQEVLNKAEQLTRDKGWQGELVIAKGTRPEVGRTILFPIMEKPENNLKLDFAGLESIFAAKEPAIIEKTGITAKAVKPGDLLIRARMNPDAEPGKDVFGVTKETIVEPLPGVGEYVQFRKEEGEYKSMIYGYLLLKNNIISILPPFWISPDRMAAYYINLPQVGPDKYPSTSDLNNILLLMGIHEKRIKSIILDKICEKSATGQELPRIVKMAEGALPENGKNSVFSLCFDPGKKAGAIRDDGSLDMRERNSVVSVKQGAIIAEKILATKGLPGFTLFGKKIGATDGADEKVDLGDGVKTRKKEDRILYVAKKAGNVHFSQKKLTVVDIYHVTGDVDYETGNLDIETDLLISGSVLSGFTVKSQGNICIQGSVDNGATVFSKGDLSVEKGIVGAKTRVISLGNLDTVYIQDAEVIVKGNVVIKSYLFNCILRANGTITVLKAHGGKSGRAIGGIACSSTGIQLSTAGGPANPRTIISIRPDPEITSQLNKIEEQGRYCSESISKISRTLPFDCSDPGQIKAILAKLEPSKKEKMVNLLTVFSKLIKQQKAIKEKKQELNDQVNLAMQKATIRITQEIFQGSEIQMDEKKLVINTDAGPTSFRLIDGKIVG